MENLLSEIGFYEVWLNQSVGDIKSFLSLVEQRLHNNFLQNWQARLEQSSSALFYQEIALFGLQPYFITVSKFRIALSKIKIVITLAKCRNRYINETAENPL